MSTQKTVVKKASQLKLGDRVVYDETVSGRLLGTPVTGVYKVNRRKLTVTVGAVGPAGQRFVVPPDHLFSVLA